MPDECGTGTNGGKSDFFPIPQAEIHPAWAASPPHSHTNTSDTHTQATIGVKSFPWFVQELSDFPQFCPVPQADTQLASAASTWHSHINTFNTHKQQLVQEQTPQTSKIITIFSCFTTLPADTHPTLAASTQHSHVNAFNTDKQQLDERLSVLPKTLREIVHRRRTRPQAMHFLQAPFSLVWVWLLTA